MHMNYMETNCYNAFKIVLIGDLGVGKTATLIRYCCKDFVDPVNVCMLAVDYRVKKIVVDSVEVQLQLWDTGGNGMPYYKNVSALICMFDVCSELSLKHIDMWAQNAALNCKPDIVKLLIGNKCDLIGQRKVSYEEGSIKAHNLSMKYIEISAKTGENVEQAFTIICKELINAKVS